MKIPLLVLAFLCIALAAKADPIVTINSSDFARGTNVSAAVTGVTLQHLTPTRDGAIWRIDSSDVFIEEVRYGRPYSDSMVGFGGTWNADDYDRCRRNMSGFGCADFGSGLEVTFDTPTDFVSILGINGPDHSALQVYSVTGQLLADCRSNHLVYVSGPGCYLGLIRFGGHLPCGGYDVPTDGRHTQAPAAPAI